MTFTKKGTVVFTKAELKVIFSTLVNHLAMLEAQRNRTGWPATEETKLTKSILNMIQPMLSEGHSICGVYYD